MIKMTSSSLNSVICPKQVGDRKACGKPPQPESSKYTTRDVFLVAESDLTVKEKRKKRIELGERYEPFLGLITVFGCVDNNQITYQLKVWQNQA